MAQVEVQQGIIDYDDRGAGRPVVCVHGYLSLTLSMIDQPDVLAAHVAAFAGAAAPVR